MAGRLLHRNCDMCGGRFHLVEVGPKEDHACTKPERQRVEAVKKVQVVFDFCLELIYLFVRHVSILKQG